MISQKRAGEDQTDSKGKIARVLTSSSIETASLKSISSKESLPSNSESSNSSSDLTRNYTNTINSTWSRPKVPSSLDLLVFQQIEVLDFNGSVDGEELSMIRIFGVSESGNSVLLTVKDFQPYFYLPAVNGFKNDHLKMFQIALENAIVLANPKYKNAVLIVSSMEKSSIYGYQEQKGLFIKVTLRTQQMMSVAKRVLKQGFNVNGFGNFSCFQTFESNIPFPLRFMIDSQMQGCSWITLKNYLVSNSKVSTCQLEVEAKFNDILTHQPEGEWQKIAPLRILSFDIECAGRKGVFPEAKEDPVIQIANIVTIQGEKTPAIKNIFTLNTCAHILGAEIRSFEKEEDLLQQWCDFVVQADPDIIIGIEIN
jgi:DNA polymerase delta subunit 1